MTTAAAQMRKIKKPMIERRRRERINECLNQLKSIVLNATDKDETQYSKMEKADILEMTVAYLQTIRHRRRASSSPSSCVAAAVAADSTEYRFPATTQVDDSDACVRRDHPHDVRLRYAAGYAECASLVQRCLVDIGGTLGQEVTSSIGDRLVRHLVTLTSTTGSCGPPESDDAKPEDQSAPTVQMTSPQSSCVVARVLPTVSCQPEVTSPRLSAVAAFDSVVGRQRASMTSSAMSVVIPLYAVSPATSGASDDDVNNNGACRRADVMTSPTRKDCSALPRDDEYVVMVTDRSQARESAASNDISVQSMWRPW